ncbi:MAG: glutamate racemase [Capnocytophaga sp.]|nr:glutamate racemase [Capnocytophaga sp.]
MIQDNPIGLFDSGVGGTTIWKEIVAFLPNENTLFLADNLNAPYGQKSKEEITRLCEKNTRFLLENQVKIVIVACNTATTNAISYLRNKFEDISFIGIEPAIKPAALSSVTGKVGVLATKGTLSSELFLKTSYTSAQQTGIQIVERVGEGLIELIESGRLESPEMFQLLQEYLLPMVSENIDYLVLGCTHYPYLLPQIQKIIPPHIRVIDSGYAVARQTHKVLSTQGLLRKANRSQAVHQWFANGTIEVLQQFRPKSNACLNIQKCSF